MHLPLIYSFLMFYQNYPRNSYQIDFHSLSVWGYSRNQNETLTVLFVNLFLILPLCNSWWLQNILKDEFFPSTQLLK